MTPRRSATTRRKHDSTMQAVNLLNSVMETSRLATNSPRSRNPRISPRLEESSVNRASHSNATREFPRSPGQQQRRRQSAPLSTTQIPSPRRSLRLQNDQPQAQSSPLRRSHRLRVHETAWLERPNEDGHGDLGLVSATPSDEESIGGDAESSDEENIGNYAELSEDDNPEDELLSVRLLSDDAPDFPSPSVFFAPTLSLGSQESDQSETTPDGKTSHENNTRGSPTKLATSQTRAHTRNRPAKTVASEPSVVVYIDAPRESGNPERAIAANTPIQVDQDGESDSDENMVDNDSYADPVEELDNKSDDVEHQVNGESDSVYETAEPSSPGSSPLFVPQDDPSPAVTPRRERRSLRAQTQHMEGIEYFSSPLPISSSTPEHHLSRHPRQPSHNQNATSQRLDSDSDKDVEWLDNYPRLKEAFHLGQQQENWRIVTNGARELSGVTNPSLAADFQDITKLIVALRQKYVNIRKGFDTYQTPSTEDVRLCDSWLKCIPLEGDQILDQVYYMAKNSNERRSRKLLGEFEARVVPQMVKLILACFDAYHAKPRGFPTAYDHLYHAMTLLLHFCERMRGLTVENYVPGHTRTLRIRAALKQLIETSKSQRLKNNLIRQPDERYQNPSVEENTDDEHFAQEEGTPWTDGECQALLAGLEQYQDADRYLWIRTDFNTKLGQRTIRELRLQAEKLHDLFKPTFRDELRTTEGRRKWRWMLSIRESW